MAAAFAESYRCGFVVDRFQPRGGGRFPGQPSGVRRGGEPGLEFSTRNGVRVVSFTQDLDKREILELGIELRRRSRSRVELLRRRGDDVRPVRIVPAAQGGHRRAAGREEARIRVRRVTMQQGFRLQNSRRRDRLHGQRASKRVGPERSGLRGRRRRRVRGPCHVANEDLVDLDDAREGEFIHAASMAHVIVEHPGVRSRDGGARGSGSSCASSARSWARRGFASSRSGDDVFFDARKLTVSIAAPGPESSLIHLGINVDPEGAPVPAAGLGEMKIDSDGSSRGTARSVPARDRIDPLRHAKVRPVRRVCRGRSAALGAPVVRGYPKRRTAVPRPAQVDRDEADAKDTSSRSSRSIQGEGIYVGERQVFVRTAGCSATCSWCDTYWSKIRDGRTSSSTERDRRSLENPVTVEARREGVLCAQRTRAIRSVR